MPVEKSAGVIIFYLEENGEIKYLLLRHKPDSWDFPKGLVEKGEKLEDAAIRESKEETGIEIKEFLPGFKETIKFFFKVKYEYQIKRGFKMGQTVLKFVTYFLAQAQTKNVKISFEHEGYEWISFGELIKRLKKRKESLKIINKVNEHIRKNFKETV